MRSSEGITVRTVGSQRSFPPRVRLRVLATSLVNLLLVATFTPAAPSENQTNGVCSYGHTRSLLEAFPPFFHYQPPRFEYPDCQYRVFLDGEEVTFKEGDWILAGSVLFLEYRQLGLTREEAIAILEGIEQRLWLAEIQPNGQLGTIVEKEILEAGFKDFPSPIFGHSVYKSTGAIMQLEPGQYLSIYQATFEGDVLESEMVVRVIASQ